MNNPNNHYDYGGPPGRGRPSLRGNRGRRFAGFAENAELWNQHGRRHQGRQHQSQQGFRPSTAQGYGGQRSGTSSSNQQNLSRNAAHRTDGVGSRTGSSFIQEFREHTGSNRRRDSAYYRSANNTFGESFGNMSFNGSNRGRGDFQNRPWNSRGSRGGFNSTLPTQLRYESWQNRSNWNGHSGNFDQSFAVREMTHNGLGDPTANATGDVFASLLSITNNKMNQQIPMSTSGRQSTLANQNQTTEPTKKVTPDAHPITLNHHLATRNATGDVFANGSSRTIRPEQNELNQIQPTANPLSTLLYTTLANQNQSTELTSDVATQTITQNPRDVSTSLLSMANNETTQQNPLSTSRRQSISSNQNQSPEPTKEATPEAQTITQNPQQVRKITSDCSTNKQNEKENEQPNSSDLAGPKENEQPTSSLFSQTNSLDIAGRKDSEQPRPSLSPQMNSSDIAGRKQHEQPRSSLFPQMNSSDIAGRKDDQEPRPSLFPQNNSSDIAGRKESEKPRLSLFPQNNSSDIAGRKENEQPKPSMLRQPNSSNIAERSRSVMGTRSTTSAILKRPQSSASTSTAQKIFRKVPELTAEKKEMFAQMDSKFMATLAAKTEKRAQSSLGIGRSNVSKEKTSITSASQNVDSTVTNTTTTTKPAGKVVVNNSEPLSSSTSDVDQKVLEPLKKTEFPEMTAAKKESFAKMNNSFLARLKTKKSERAKTSMGIPQVKLSSSESETEPSPEPSDMETSTIVISEEKKEKFQGLNASFFKSLLANKKATTSVIGTRESDNLDIGAPPGIKRQLPTNPPSKPRALSVMGRISSFGTQQNQNQILSEKYSKQVAPIVKTEDQSTLLKRPSSAISGRVSALPKLDLLTEEEEEHPVTPEPLPVTKTETNAKFESTSAITRAAKPPKQNMSKNMPPRRCASAISGRVSALPKFDTLTEEDEEKFSSPEPVDVPETSSRPTSSRNLSPDQREHFAELSNSFISSLIAKRPESAMSSRQTNLKTVTVAQVDSPVNGENEGPRPSSVMDLVARHVGLPPVLPPSFTQLRKPVVEHHKNSQPVKRAPSVASGRRSSLTVPSLNTLAEEEDDSSAQNSPAINSQGFSNRSFNLPSTSRPMPAMWRNSIDPHVSSDEEDQPQLLKHFPDYYEVMANVNRSKKTKPKTLPSSEKQFNLLARSMDRVSLINNVDSNQFKDLRDHLTRAEESGKIGIHFQLPPRPQGN